MGNDLARRWWLGTLYGIITGIMRKAVVSNHLVGSTTSWMCPHDRRQQAYILLIMRWNPAAIGAKLNFDTAGRITLKDTSRSPCIVYFPEIAVQSSP
nr:hypothetical protein CFP56_24361 [Quercus suber]